MGSMRKHKPMGKICNNQLRLGSKKKKERKRTRDGRKKKQNKKRGDDVDRIDDDGVNCDDRFCFLLLVDSLSAAYGFIHSPASSKARECSSFARSDKHNCGGTKMTFHVGS